MFQGFGNAAAANGRAALTFTGARAALAVVSGRQTERPRLAAGIFDVPADPADGPDLRAVDLEGHNLQRMKLSTVLPGGSYQMLLEELPSAPRDELLKAIAWRIRDRIDTPLDEAVIELLEMPPYARAGHKPAAYAAVTRRDVVDGLVRTLRRSGLKLDAIDLPELCLRNIAVRLPQDDAGVAFLHFTDECGFLTITRQGVLYLMRRIEVGRGALLELQAADAMNTLIPTISLELQRSLDYYETQYDCRPVSDLVLGPGRGTDVLRDALKEQLGLKVTCLDLADLFDMAETLDSDMQNECLFAVGAALRSDATAKKDA